MHEKISFTSSMDGSHADEWRTGELRAENAYVANLYDRLESQRELAASRLGEVHRQGKGGTIQSRLERDALELRHTRRLAELYAAEYGLCFGRLDTADGERQYIGRIALADDELDPLLTDWRASAAEPFYRATPASPGGVVGRRHLRSKGRTVVDFDDDAFGVDGLEGRDASELSGETALLASLTAARTGRMGDIVSTIQAEQDRVIRSELGGVLVVQGGPGTGKTVVALHRAAYLLYTHRDRLAKRGVLVIGPNKMFLRYIDAVLPALGESEVVLSSIGTLYPGVVGTDAETPAGAAVKGDKRMVGVVTAALELFRELPSAEEPWTITVGKGTAERETFSISRVLCERAQGAARTSGLPHNVARAALVERLSSELALRIGKARGGMDLDDVARLADALVDDPELRGLADRLWPFVSPEGLLATAFGSAEILARVMPEPEFSAAERAAVLRSGSASAWASGDGGPAPEASAEATADGSDVSGLLLRTGSDTGAAWTTADVPLLDEAAELLGPLPSAGAARRAELASEAADDAAELEFAQRVLDDFGVGLVEMDARMLARQYRGDSSLRPLAERAAEDRTWAFGHVIVDEAQELSAMDWRMLARRCPNRSMTIVGDLAQTGAAAGLSTWGEALEEYTSGRWRTVELKVNYRTPSEIMEITGGVLRAIDPALAAPSAVRSGGIRPWSLRVSGSGPVSTSTPASTPASTSTSTSTLAPAPAPTPTPTSADRGAALSAVVEKEIAAQDGGRMAIIHAPTWPSDLVAALAALDGVAAVTDGASALDSPVVLLTPAESKGLEFDAVLVLEPSEIVAAHVRGVNDLYVALTRATKSLGVLHGEELPEMLEGLEVR